VDLDAGVVTVREGKFRKSRLVPLHPSALEPLCHYAACRDHCCGAPRSESFFRTEYAPSLTRMPVERAFLEIRRRLGWTAEGRARLPRIHDLRHNAGSRIMPGGRQNGGERAASWLCDPALS
jgi:integrase